MKQARTPRPSALPERRRWRHTGRRIGVYQMIAPLNDIVLRSPGYFSLSPLYQNSICPLNLNSRPPMIS
jgi:hypothetical protein